MIWALLEIVIPLLLAFGVGLLTGWLLWRWRRRRVSAHEWNRLNAASESTQTDLATIRAARDEAINERTAMAATLASVNADLETQKSELDLARRRNVELAGELDGAERRIEQLSDELSEASTRVTALESGLASAQRTISGITQGGDESPPAEVAALEGSLTAVRRELDASQARIADLEAMLAQSERPGAADDDPPVSADTTAMAAEIGQLRVELAERDRRIRALEQATRKSDDT